MRWWEFVRGQRIPGHGLEAVAEAAVAHALWLVEARKTVFASDHSP